MRARIKLGWSSPLLIVLLTLMAVAMVGVGAPDRALAENCDSRAQKNVEGIGDGAFNYGYTTGFRAEIHVNDFADPQCHTTRSISVAQGGANFIELGWIKASIAPSGLSRFVFYNRKEDGVLHTHPQTQFSPPGGSDRNFKIENPGPNQDHDWRVVYDGHLLTDEAHQSYRVAAYSLTNSEKDYSSDSMYAHFFDLGVCIYWCGQYNDPTSYREIYNNTAEWKWCKVNNREHYVRQDHC